MKVALIRSICSAYMSGSFRLLPSFAGIVCASDFVGSSWGKRVSAVYQGTRRTIPTLVVLQNCRVLASRTEEVV